MTKGQGTITIANPVHLVNGRQPPVLNPPLDATSARQVFTLIQIPALARTAQYIIRLSSRGKRYVKNYFALLVHTAGLKQASIWNAKRATRVATIQSKMLQTSRNASRAPWESMGEMMAQYPARAVAKENITRRKDR